MPQDCPIKSMTIENFSTGRLNPSQGLDAATKQMYYEESVVDKFKSNLLLMIFWLNIINYNS